MTPERIAERIPTTAEALDAMIAEVWLHCATTESMDHYRALREFHQRLVAARAALAKVAR